MFGKYTDFVKKLQKEHIINFDKNIERSIIQFDIDRTILFPEIMKELCDLYCNYISRPFNEKYDYIVAMPFDQFSPIIATKISEHLSIPLLLYRPDENKIIGNDENHMGKNILVIQGIVSYGTECVEFSRVAKQYGLYVSEIICMIKMFPIPLGKIFNIGDTGIISIHSLFNINDIEFFVKLESSNICIEPNVNTMDELEYIISIASRYVSVFKININMIKDFLPYDKSGQISSIRKLQEMKQKYGILLWESTNRLGKPSEISQQLLYGIHKISLWADIVSISCMNEPNVFLKKYTGSCKIILDTDLYCQDKDFFNKICENIINIVDPEQNRLLNIDVQYNQIVCKNVVGITGKYNSNMTITKYQEIDIEKINPIETSCETSCEISYETKKQYFTINNIKTCYGESLYKKLNEKFKKFYK